jgi:hypothetical protein
MSYVTPLDGAWCLIYLLLSYQHHAFSGLDEMRLITFELGQKQKQRPLRHQDCAENAS